MSIKNNITALNAQRNLMLNDNRLAKIIEKLSTGLNINSAADDAAGLAISVKMRAQIRGLNMASKNAMDGISLIQTAEGALQQLHNTLQRMRDIAVQAASDTNESSIDRAALDKEFQALKAEIDCIAATTRFNDRTLLDGRLSRRGASSAPLAEKGAKKSSDTEIQSGSAEFALIPAIGAAPSTSVPGSVNWTNVGGKNLNWLRDLITDVLAPQAVNSILSTFDSLDFFRGSTIGIGLSHAGLGGAQGMVSYSWTMGGANPNGLINLSLRVDTAYINSITTATGFISADAEKQFYSLIAHELTHAVMGITHTNGMVGSGDRFPLWFSEGVAQSVGGPIGWIDHLGPNPTNAQIQTLTNQLLTANGYGEYGAGYLASMYLGWLIGGGGAVNSATISSGLNVILGQIAAGKSLNTVINEYTPFSGLTNFQTTFRAGTTEIYDFVRALISATAGGTGSILENLNAPSILVPPIAPGSSTETFLKIDNTVTTVGQRYPPGYTLLSGGGSTQNGTPVHPTFDPNAPTTNPPVLAPGTANRTADDEATVIFYSDKPGDIYYIVRDANDSTPLTANDIKTLGTPGGLGTAGQNTINLTGLPTVAQRIYIVKEDVNGLSNTIQIGIPVFGASPNTPQAEAHGGPSKGLVLQIGANQGDTMSFYIESMSVYSLGLVSENVANRVSASAAIGSVSISINLVSTQRAELGAYQNRLEHKIASLDISAENLQAAEMRIRDADMAKKMAEFVKIRILTQTGTAMLAQANLQPLSVLSLLE